MVGHEKTGSIGNVDYYALIMSDGTEYYYTVTNGVPGDKGEPGEPGEPGAPGDKGDKGDKGSGCGRSIAGTAALSGVALAAVAATVVFRRKKTN